MKTVSGIGESGKVPARDLDTAHIQPNNQWLLASDVSKYKSKYLVLQLTISIQQALPSSSILSQHFSFGMQYYAAPKIVLDDTF